MKNKFSDNTSNIDNSPERNQESTEKGEIKLLDVVALTQDVLSIISNVEKTAWSLKSFQTVKRLR